MKIFKRILGVIIILLTLPAFLSGFVRLVDDSQSFFQNFIFGLIGECVIILGLLLIYMFKLIICWCFNSIVNCFNSIVNCFDPDSY